MPYIDVNRPSKIEDRPEFAGIYNRWGLYNYQMPGWKHHVCFTGHSYEGWQRLQFPPPRFNYGEGDDAYLHAKEMELGLPVKQIDLTVYHLFHGLNRLNHGANPEWVSQNQTGESARIRRIKASVHSK
jgi:hypothetical protein